MNEYLSHHGILGQKWGVRRFQNFDGSYTRKGLERYNKKKDSYDSAKSEYKSTKEKYKSGAATKQNVKDAKSDYKLTKRDMNKSYKKLKYDKLADQGKEMFSQGKRIKVNEKREATLAATTTIAAAAVTHLATKGKKISTRYGDIPVSTVAPAAITVGGAVIGGLLAAKNTHTNKRLRAFYGHK